MATYYTLKHWKIKVIVQGEFPQRCLTDMLFHVYCAMVSVKQVVELRNA